MATTALGFGALLGFLGVLLGAFGAHGLREKITPEMMAIWQTAVLYHFLHALALLALGLWMRQFNVTAPLIVTFFVAGVILFSGSLYAYVNLGYRWLAILTPIGGTSLLVAWAAWAWRIWKG